MKRVISLAILGVVALAPVASAQMRGGGMGGGRSSGFSRGSAAPARVGGAAFAPRPMGAPGVGARGGVVGVRTGVVGVRTVAPSRHVVFTTTPFPHRFHNGHVFFHNCFGFPCANRFFFGNPFFFGGGFGFGWPLGYSGYYPYSDYPSYPADYYPQAAAPATSDSSGNVQLAVEMQRLSDEVEDLRNETRQAAAARPPGGSWSVQEPGAAATFVFRDGRHITSPNYAIAGQTLWIFSEHTAHKYSLADLDRGATDQVNAANGVELRLPEAR
jgi:hypothetical protein